MRKFSVLLTALLLIGVSAVFGQERSISGKVLDSESGEPLVGVSISVVGADTGTSTDENGDFTVTLPDGFTKLRVEQTSYKTQEVTAAEGMVIRLVLSSTVLSEAEIEVSFNTKKGKGYVGSAQTVQQETIEKKSPSDITKALAGEFSGVRIATNTGQPGVESKVRIRGIASLNAGGDALYVVDGIPYGGDVSSIDPNDIVSTTVLKDATATAMYGARGANGVILITTKKGTAGSEGKIEVDLQTGINFRLLPMHDRITTPEEYMEAGWLGLANYFYMNSSTPNYDVAKQQATDNLWNMGGENELSGLPIAYNIWTQNDVIDPKTGKIRSGLGRKYSPESWQDHIFRIGKKYSAGVKISGGSDKTTYFTSINYLNDEGYYIRSKYNRLTATTNLDYSPKKWLTANFKAMYAYSTMNRLGQGDGANNGFNFVYYVPPIYPVFRHNPADGSLYKDEYLGGNQYDYGRELKRPFSLGINPAGALQLDQNLLQQHNLALSNFLKFEFIKDLVITITNGYNFNFQQASQILNKFYGDAQGVGYVYKTDQMFTDFTSRQQIAYKKTVSEIHNLDAMFGHDFRTLELKQLSANRSGMVKPYDFELDNAIKLRDASSTASDYTSESYMGEVRYNYDEKYFATANGSVYGSSNFAPGNQYGLFWSVGAAWNIHRELFMASAKKWISSLKVRANFGASGNDQIGSYRYTDMYSIINSYDQPAVNFVRKGNPNLTWETAYKANLGVDLELKKGKLYLEADLYNTTIVNTLAFRSVARSNGYNYIPVNDGKFRNYGLELMVKANLLKTRDVDVNFRVTGSYSKALVLANPRVNVKSKLVEMPLNDGRAVGHFIGDIYTRRYMGVDSETGFGQWEQWTDDNASKPDDPVLDTYIYEHEKTVDDNGNIVNKRDVQWVKEQITNDPNKASRFFIGKNAYPDVFGGFGIDASAYGFDFSASFEYLIGGYNYDRIYQNLMGDGLFGKSNYHKDIFKAWTPDNTNTNVPILLAGKVAQATASRPEYNGDWSDYGSDRFLISNTALKLSNVRLAYNFPHKMIEKVKLKSLSLWVRADNLFVLSHRKGYDPFTYFGGGNDRYQYTPLSTLVGGLKFTF